MNKITDSFKNSFIEAVILANKELYTYISTDLSFKDFQYTNTTGFGGDNSLNIDIKAENIFIKHLQKFGNIYSEECGMLNFNKDYTIVIDPLDGSNNFCSSLPYYGTSVALQKEGKTIAGFVTNLVTAIVTHRVFDEDIKYISLKNLEEIKPLNFSKSKISIFERAYSFPNICQQLIENSIKFRSLGAVALSLCDARNYDFVLFGGNMREFDIAASLYICNDLFIHKTNNLLLISKNKQKFDQIKEIIKE